MVNSQEYLSHSYINPSHSKIHACRWNFEEGNSKSRWERKRKTCESSRLSLGHWPNFDQILKSQIVASHCDTYGWIERRNPMHVFLAPLTRKAAHFTLTNPETRFIYLVLFLFFIWYETCAILQVSLQLETRYSDQEFLFSLFYYLKDGIRLDATSWLQTWRTTERIVEGDLYGQQGMAMLFLPNDNCNRWG